MWPAPRSSASLDVQAISGCETPTWRANRDWGERLKDSAPYFADLLQHSTNGAYWYATDLRRQLHNINTPMLHVGSWYDVFQYDTLTMFTGLREQAMTAEARRSQKLIMGPWGHLLPYAIPTSKGTGDIDFGPEALIELHDIHLRWFDHFLKGVQTSLFEEAPIRLLEDLKQHFVVNGHCRHLFQLFAL
jgi:putative CocE/NonD family hydrolase